MSIAIQRIERAIADMPKGGMQTGKQTIKLEYSDAQRAIAELTDLKRRNDELVAQVEVLSKALQNQLNDCINFDGGKLTDSIMEHSSIILKSTPTQHLRDRYAGWILPGAALVVAAFIVGGLICAAN